MNLPLRSIRRGIFRSGAAVGVAALAALAAASTTRAEPGFSPLHGTFFASDTLTVYMTVDAAVTDLRGFTFVLEFNPAIVRPVSVQAGPLETGAGCPHFFTWLNATAVGDSLAMDGATLGCSVAGPGSIVTLRWVGVAAGISPLRCRRGLMRDSLNQPVPSTCPDGSIRYLGPIPVEVKPWAMFKRLFR